ncbi:MAG: GxxExxY protein [Pyrinomonadaceae bacterium]|nr:GxxExxY protein [Pyrinomonadaceae bacterium]
MSELIFKDESYAIIGACFEVYKNKGCGFVEPVYQECLEIEFDFQKIQFNSQERLDIYYRERKLEQFYKPDFICFGKIIVEIKAIQKLCDENRAQVMNYLKATGFELGLLINFGYYPKLEYERIAWTKTKRI